MSDYTPLPFELDHEEGYVVDTVNGMTGHREFICLWQDRNKVAPRKGQAYPGYPNLHCASREFRGLGPAQPDVLDVDGEPCRHTYCHIICEYSTFTRLEGQRMWSFHGAAEMLETGIGRRWADTGTVCDTYQGTFYPNCNVQCSFLSASNPIARALDCVSKLNWGRIMERSGIIFEPETLLLLAPEVEPILDYERSLAAGEEVWYWKVDYHFLWRPCSHNIVWRAPRQQLDSMGNPVTTGPPNFDPVFVAGPAGVGAWTRLIPALYELADFGPMLGMAPSLRPIYPWSEADEGSAGLGGLARQSA